MRWFALFFFVASSHGNAQTASDLFWQIFNAGEYQNIAEARSALKDYLTTDPSNGYIRRLLGITYFWSAAESSREEGDKSAADLIHLGRELRRAKRDAPNDRWLPCFLGLEIYSKGAMLRNDRLKAQGLAEFARGIALEERVRPVAVFTLYCRALARAMEPRGSAEFRRSLEDFWTTIRACDRTVTESSPRSTDPLTFVTCSPNPRAPHLTNGFWQTAGDVFLKAGRLDLAVSFYENAKMARYESWPFKDHLETRIQKAAENLELWQDHDKTNDPQLSFNSAFTCVQCHQSN
jgi:hypothetical protein